MLERRTFLTLAGATMVLTLTHALWTPARAQTADQAIAFVRDTGDKLVAVVNGPGTTAQKRATLMQVIDQRVDVDGVAKFCLGRFWHTATPEQQAQYTKLFHDVLVTNITGKLGDYQGVSFTMGRGTRRGDNAVVSTVINRPNNAPTQVDWIISDDSGSPKIIDVIAEGTSLRLTQRSDYASYLARNGNSVDALISAMRQQVAQNG